MTGEYKVDLDVYNGPIDLLLYLIRKEEVNIYDIPIARITDQYSYPGFAMPPYTVSIDP